MKIAVFGNTDQKEFLDAIEWAFGQMRQRGLSVAVDGDYYEHLHSLIPHALDGAEVLPREHCVDADLALSIGGDGTFLATAQRVATLGIPILGVNAGHLGYLTAVELNGIGTMLDNVLAGDYVIEHRSMLQVRRTDGVAIKNAMALNEIALTRADSSSMLTLCTEVDGESLTTYRGDGLVVSTPTGSTAYNLSCGGPILSPQARNVVITPVSPHSLTMRPVVLPDDAVIRVTVTTRSGNFRLSLDRFGELCPAGTTVEITKAPHQVKVIQRQGNNFARTLRTKLSWGQ